MMLARAAWRHLWRHPWQSVLALLGVALGVAVVLAVDIANGSARRAFMLSSEALSGRATHELVGGPAGIDERLYPGLRRIAGVQAAPLVEGYLESADGRRRWRLLGVDVFAEGPLRGATLVGSPAGGGDGARLLVEPDTVLLDADSAARLGVRVGDQITVRVAGRPRALRIVATPAPAGAAAREALDGMLVADIATAQELLRQVGRLSRIDLRVAADAEPALRAALPADVRLLPAGARSAALAQMAQAFATNLLALSLLALVVGAFLIYNTMTFSVVQRRAVIGTLRALGVTRAQILLAVLGESLLLGMLGTALGIGLGMLLAAGLLDLVSGTINDLYFALSVRETHVAALSLAKAAALGVGATLAAALVPAAEAAGVAPTVAQRRSTLEERVRRLMPWALAAALASGLAGLALLAAAGGNLTISFAGLFALILGFALAAPFVTYAGLRVLGRALGGGGLMRRMATRAVAASLSRTGVAITALAVAVAAVIGVGMMIDSFRSSVARWLDQTLRADLYISVPAAGRSTADLGMDLATDLAALPQVDSVSLGRRVRLDTDAGGIELFAVRLSPRAYASFELLDGWPAEAWPRFLAGAAVYVSEPYAHRHHVAPGDRVRLPTDAGLREFEIAAVYRDYSSDQGVVLMERGLYERWWRDRAVNSIGVYARPGVDVDQLRQHIRARVDNGQALAIQSNRSLRAASLAVFDRTFAVTQVLRLLAMLVAFVGILSALLAIELERGAEFALLRVVGLTPAQLGRMVAWETGIMGLAAGLLALPLGLLLAWLLVRVINVRAFGWSMSFEIDAGILAQGILLAVVAALLAGLYPAWRMARTAPARALREE